MNTTLITSNKHQIKYSSSSLPKQFLNSTEKVSTTATSKTDCFSYQKQTKESLYSTSLNPYRITLLTKNPKQRARLKPTKREKEPS